MLDPDKISFRELRFDDLPLLHDWLNTPHVHEWYDKDEQNTLDEIKEKYGKKINKEEPTDSYLIMYDNQPIGYIQTAKVKDWPTLESVVGKNQQAASIDLFIGEPNYLGKGLGSQVIRKFLTVVVFQRPDIIKCFIDPEPSNVRAIKSYEKAGFKYLKTVQIPGEPEPAYLMEIKKEDLVHYVQ
ncbi:MAG TPA: GNAT family N-acetyltransferase [Patescibacteria group bacterium]